MCARVCPPIRSLARKFSARTSKEQGRLTGLHFRLAFKGEASGVLVRGFTRTRTHILCGPRAPHGLGFVPSGAASRSRVFALAWPHLVDKRLRQRCAAGAHRSIVDNQVSGPVRLAFAETGRRCLNKKSNMPLRGDEAASISRASISMTSPWALAP